MIDKILKIQNSKLLVDNEPLLDSQEVSLLTADVASGSNTITLDNISGFSVGKFILIGNFGEPNAEIIRVHISSAPSGFTVTLNSNTTQTHQANSPVTIVDYDQVEYSRATTLTGDKSVLATSNIQADRKQTSYSDTTNTTGFAFFRFKNSADSTFSEYSIGVDYSPVTRAYDTLRTLADKALRQCKERINTSLTYQDFIDFAEDFYQELYTFKRNWRIFRSLDTSVSTTPAQDYVTLPSDVDTIDQVKIGSDGRALKRVNLTEFNKLKSVTSVGEPYYYHQIDRKLMLYPTPNAVDTVYLYKFYQPTRVTSLDDAIDASRSGLFLFSTYLRYRIYDTVNSKPEKGKEWSNKFYALLESSGSKEDEETIGENEYIEITQSDLFEDDFNTGLELL